jgi:ketosteroid isomerase-like protein
MRPTLLAAAFALSLTAGPLSADSPAATPPGRPAEAPTVALPPELDRVLRDYERLWRAGDTAALAELFSEDGWVFASGNPPAQGRAAIRKTYEAMDGGPLRLRALAYATDGSTGYLLGAYGYGDEAPGGGDSGKFTLTLRRSPEGRWLIASDMDNLNQPQRCPGAPSPAQPGSP